MQRNIEMALKGVRREIQSKDLSQKTSPNASKVIDNSLNNNDIYTTLNSNQFRDHALIIKDQNDLESVLKEQEN